MDNDHIISKTLDATEKLIFESGSKFKTRFELLKFIKMMRGQDKTPKKLRLKLVKQFLEKHHDFNPGDVSKYFTYSSVSNKRWFLIRVLGGTFVLKK